MSRDGLATLMQAHRQAMETDEERRSTHETIWGILSSLSNWDITIGQALRILGAQATRVADQPTHAALYRQAAADIRQMQQGALTMSETADEALRRQRFIRMLHLISAGTGRCRGCEQVRERFVKRKAQAGNRSPRCLDCWKAER